MSGYVYLVHLNPLVDDIKDAQIKIGMSSKKNDSRIETYTKYSNLLRKIMCSNYNEVESFLVTAFTKKFKCYQGIEYFIGNLKVLLHFFDVCIDQINIDINEIKIDINFIVDQYSENLGSFVLNNKIPTEKEAFNSILDSLKEQTSLSVVSTIEYIRDLEYTNQSNKFVIPFEKLYEAGVIQQSKKIYSKQPSNLLIKNREMKEGKDFMILKTKRKGDRGGKLKYQYMMNLYSFIKVLTTTTGNGIIPSEVYCDYIILNNTLQNMFINTFMKPN